MPHNRRIIDYDPVTPFRGERLRGGEVAAPSSAINLPRANASTKVKRNSDRIPPLPPRASQSVLKKENWLIKRGHLISYWGLFIYTAFICVRPYEIYPSLAWMMVLSFWLGLATLLIFLPSQFALEGTLTSRPAEVNLLLLLCFAALLSIPLAFDRGLAWDTFTKLFIKVVLMFIVMVNVVRTERRLKGLLFLALAVGCFVCIGAINNYRLGIFSFENYRVAAGGTGLFGEPNIMALYFVTMIPIAAGWFLSTRNLLTKAFCGVTIVLMLAGIMVTYSRGGFLGLMVIAPLLTWKLGRRNRFLIMVGMLVAAVVFLAFMPGGYLLRVASIFNHSLDPNGSANARQDQLFRSIYVALTHPLFGVGMGNFVIVGIRGLATHNAFTQVAAEMGIPALIAYVMFMIVPFKRLRRIERETLTREHHMSRFYYLSVALQVSIIGYMVTSFFVHVAYDWNIYFLVSYAVCLRRIYEAENSADLNITSDDNQTAHSGKMRGRREAVFQKAEAAYK